VINPADREQAVGEAGLNISDSVKGGPVDGVKLRCAPVVDAAHMLDLRFLVGVGKRRAADVADLGGKLTRD
jgi:hypothetical protein